LHKLHNEKHNLKLRMRCQLMKFDCNEHHFGGEKIKLAKNRHSLPTGV
jgi:hypothetical protein